METFIQILVDTYGTVTQSVANSAPKLLATTIVVVVGLLLARTVKAVLHRILDGAGFEKLAHTMGISSVLERADVGQTSSEIICTLAYWAGLIFTALVALGTMGFANASAFDAVAAIVPSVVIAVAIVVIGLNVSSFLSKLIQTAAVNAEVRQARLIRNVAHYGMGTLVVIMALHQLGISGEILTTAFYILAAGASLALGLSFGLGCRDLAGSVAKKFWEHEQSRARTLSDASELGNHVLPSMESGQRRRTKKAAA